LARIRLGRRRCLFAAGARTAVTRRGVVRRGSPNGRLSVPYWHDAAVRTGSAGRPIDWLAARAAASANGSATRLFTVVFGVGTVVTVFLSNDATAVVLTPGCRCGRQGDRGQGSTALPADLCLHCERCVLPISMVGAGSPDAFTFPVFAAVTHRCRAARQLHGRAC
jgi:hypothetical protein